MNFSSLPESHVITGLSFLTLQITVVTICTTRFNIQESHVLLTECIYVFCVDLRRNSDYFLLHDPIELKIEGRI